MINKDENSKSQAVDNLRNQWLVCLTASLFPLTTGLANGWSSPYLAQLNSLEADTIFRLNNYETSWVASLLNLGRTIGATIGASAQGKLGKKRALLLGASVLVLGWVCIILATSVTWLYVARICCGLASGIMWTSLTLFLGEIANPKIRGCLISWNVNMSVVGIFLGNVMGPYLSMDFFAYSSLVPNILFILLFTLIPESPQYHIMRGDLVQAEKSLQWFRKKADVAKELEELKEYTTTAKITFFERLREFKQSDQRRNLAILLGLNVFAYISGSSAMNNYMEIIVRDTKIHLTPSTVVIVLSFCMIVSGFTATFLIDIIGRRKLLFISSIGVSMSLFSLGLHFFLLSYNFDAEKIYWLPLCSLFVFLVTYNYGLGPIPTTLVGEMFSHNLKVIASFLFSSSSALFAFLSALTFQPFHASVGDSFAYWICSACVLLALPFTYFFVKETKGKSLLEIQKSSALTKV